MKKLAIILSSVLVLGLTSKVQAQEFEEGTNIINLSIGFGSGLYNGLGYSSTIPGVGVSFEHGIVDDVIWDGVNIGVGAYFGVSGSKFEVDNPFTGTTYGYKYTYIIPAARGAVHYSFVDGLDTYSGIHIGAQVVTSSEIGNVPPVAAGASKGGLYASGFIGARYYFTDNIAALVELGSGIAYFNLGLTYRMD